MLQQMFLFTDTALMCNNEGRIRAHTEKKHGNVGHKSHGPEADGTGLDVDPQ